MLELFIAAILHFQNPATNTELFGAPVSLQGFVAEPADGTALPAPAYMKN